MAGITIACVPNPIPLALLMAGVLFYLGAKGTSLTSRRMWAILVVVFVGTFLAVSYFVKRS